MNLRLPEETAVTLFVNGEKTVTLMTTPAHLRQLAIGYAVNTGRIRSLEQIERIYACEDDACVMMEGSFRPSAQQDLLIASGCGQAAPVLSESIPVLPSGHRISSDTLAGAVRRMLRENRSYRETGGMHTAALVSGPYFTLAEDVGRHNAHDKVTGIALEAGVDLTRSAILSTGRISADMVSKAAIARVPVLASLSVPTSLAAELAERYGITLIGRMTKEVPAVVTCGHRYESIA